jgi:dihydroorotase/N-acyl-D-amino-acid deacylase
MKRKMFGVAVVAAIAATAILSAQNPAYDVIIRNGRIVDGTGNPWYSGDVGIRGDRVATIGRLGTASATHVIDATGMVVAPGFIDLHTHSDMAILADGNAESAIRQGVTLDVLGESSSVAPRDGLAEDAGADRATWTTFTGYFQELEKRKTSINIISHVAAEQVRRVVMGYAARPASAAELSRMQQLVARSMEEGAWGLVTRYESGGPEHPDEVIALARVAASYGGNYTSHIGSEGFEQDKELAFTIRVAREAQIPVHIFHLKIRGRELWPTMPKYLATIEAARAGGLDVTANEYPYTAMHHGWSAFFPVWAREGGPAAFAARLKDPVAREKIKRDSSFLTWSKEHGGWDGIVMSRAALPQNKQYEGRSIAQIAKLRGDSDPAETCIELMSQESGRINGIFHTMSEENVRLVMRRPWVSIASDGSAINLEADGVPHPRNFGTNPRVLGYYVREGVLTLEDAVRKMTSLPAQILGLSDRGVLRAGAAADVVVFDPSKIRDMGTFERPKAYPEGIPFVLVNGETVIAQGRHTGVRPGRAIRGKGYRSAGTTTTAQ